LIESTLDRTIGRCRLGDHRFPVSTPGAARKGEHIFVISAAAIVNTGLVHGNLQGIYDLFSTQQLRHYLLRTTAL
jgi:hypothetical protein